MSVRLGISSGVNFRQGNSQIGWIYQGDNLIWPTASVAPSEYYFEIYGYTGNATAMTEKLPGVTITNITNVGGNTFLTSSTQYYIGADAWRGSGAGVNVTRVYGTGCTSVQSYGLHGIFNLTSVSLPDCGPIYEYGINPSSGGNFNTLYIPKAYGAAQFAISPGNSFSGTLTIPQDYTTQASWPFGQPFAANDLIQFVNRQWTLTQV